jgi:hypothetical protein
MHWHSKQPLPNVILDRMWLCNIVCLLCEPRPFVKLWSKCCHLFIIDCIESKLRTLAPRRCTVIYCHQHVMGFVMIYYVVYNSLRDLNINEFDLKLKELLMHMKCQILEVYVLFISFVNGFDKGKWHNILSLMLDPRFKNMWLVIT